MRADANSFLYFDHNATTPLLPEARAAWLEATERYVGNPSSPHRLGARADAALNTARERLAAILNCDPFEIVWTSGATESNNIVFHHLKRTTPSEQGVWVSAIEHPCVLDAARHYFGKRLELIPVTRGGVVEMDWLSRSLGKHKPALIAVMAANNETGVLQPWEAVRACCREHGVPLLCDAAQWLGKLPGRGLGQGDYVSGCAHKFGGPKGVGFLKCAGGTRPLLFGGKQEEGRRAGTENVAGVLAMLAALDYRERQLADEQHKPRLAWRREFEAGLLKALPGTEIVGGAAERLWNTVSALMPRTNCPARWVVKLDRFGYAVSTGSACASGKEEPSHVLAAMGYPAHSSDRVLRFSSGWETSQRDWQALLKGLKRAHQALS